MSQIHERLCRNRPHARHARAVFVGAHASSRRASLAEDSGASIYSRKESPLTKAISHTSETGRRSKTHPEKDSLGDPATSGPSWPRERRNIRRPPQVRQKRASRRQLARMSRQRCRRSAHREANESLRDRESHRGIRCGRGRGRTSRPHEKRPLAREGKACRAFSPAMTRISELRLKRESGFGRFTTT